MESQIANAANSPALAQTTPSAQEVEKWLVGNLALLSEIPHDEVDVHALITSLGLESLTLFTLAGDLATWLNRDISATLLWEYPTIHELATHLGQETAADSEIAESKPQFLHFLVPIQPQGTLPTLYLVHDVSGTLWCYSALARHFGTEQPLYGFQLPEALNQSPEQLRLEELAALYVAEMRAHQSQGPYLLGGFSMGGAVAFEMARQLREQGQDVGSVVLMDTFFPGLERQTPSLSHKIRTHSRHLRDLENPQRVDYVRERVQKLVRSAPAKSTATQNMKDGLLETRASEQLECAFANYRALPYDGIVTLVSARTQYRVADDLSEWRKVALGGLEQHFVPGSHGTIVAEPQVLHLAELLNRCLNRPPLATNN